MDIAALEGRRDAASLYAKALGSWRRLKVTWEEALTGLDMVKVLDPSLTEVRAVAESTRQIFDRLGAAPYLAMLDDALARGTAAASRPSPVRANHPAVEAATEAG